MTRPLRTTAILALGLGLGVACGASDRNVEIGEGGSGGRAGGSPEGGDPSTGGTGEGGAPTTCVDGELRCAGDTPEICENGAWTAEEPCGGATPLCSNGVCAGVQLSGHAVTIGAAPSNDQVVLVEHGFEFTEMLCGDVGGQQICVTGGLRP